MKAIVGARIVDPASGRDAVGTILIDGRSIVAVDPPAVPAAAEPIDARGLAVAPGLIDALAFRTDVAAARAGGITRLCLMPDQSPPLDDPALVERAERIGKPAVWVHPFAAATRGLEGREMAEIGLMREAGAVGVATGRRAIASSLVMLRLCEYAAAFDMVVVTHAEDPWLADGAAATAGEGATRLGIPAAPAWAEAVQVARDLRIAEATGVRLHIAQLTTAEAVALVAAAKRRGVRVTAGVTPNHLFQSDIAIGQWRTFARLSPPLRADADRRAVIAGLADGTIDVIASGHDPRTEEDKRLPFADAAPGAAGQPFLLPLALGLVRDGVLPLAGLIGRMTSVPAAIFGLPGGRIAVGADADLVLFDADAPWRIVADQLPGVSGNTPFDGVPVSGRVVGVVKGGELSWN